MYVLEEAIRVTRRDRAPVWRGRRVVVHRAAASILVAAMPKILVCKYKPTLLSFLKSPINKSLYAEIVVIDTCSQAVDRGFSHVAGNLAGIVFQTTFPAI